MLPCPRRAEAFHHITSPETDHWRKDHTCSYCGSLNPVVLLEHMAAGTCNLGPTDKNYKAYVDLPHTQPNKLRVVSQVNYDIGERTPFGDRSKWRKANVLNRIVWKLSPSTQWFMLEPNGPTRHAKFYFQHFDDAQQQQFIDLLNAKACEIDYPGHFYRLPYFITRGAE